ncbi:MAG TPA: hypothetical protein VF405_15100 [Gammaproteobacteria bacterium]
MTDSDRFKDVRAVYRALWDAYQVISHKNAELLRAGHRPSEAALAEEQRAAVDVTVARDALLAAIARLGH